MNDQEIEAKITEIDNLLPQTQCGLCDHAGCLPYATAIVKENDAINRCLPGGVETLQNLGALLCLDPTPYLDEMKQNAKPAMLAVIREDECVGCTKCIQACPTDAIIGASKQMHTVITDACTGCELCVPPCPVDCIDMIEIEKRTEQQQKQMAEQSRQRYLARNARLTRDEKERRQKHLSAKLNKTGVPTVQARQSAIQAALDRARAKKLEKGMAE